MPWRDCLVSRSPSQRPLARSALAEQEGRDYFFLTRDAVREPSPRGSLLGMGGVCRQPVRHTRRRGQSRVCAAGLDVILEIELQGAEQVLSMCPDAVMIYIMPPSLEELERRLRGRKTESEEAIRKPAGQSERRDRHRRGQGATGSAA